MRSSRSILFLAAFSLFGTAWGDAQIKAPADLQQLIDTGHCSGCDLGAHGCGRGSRRGNLGAEDAGHRPDRCGCVSSGPFLDLTSGTYFPSS